MKQGSEVKSVRNLDMNSQHHVLVVREDSFDILLQNNQKPFTLKHLTRREVGEDVCKAAPIKLGDVTYVVVEVETE